MNRPGDFLLRWSLRGNAAFSTLCALVSLAAAAPLAASLGLPGAPALYSLGAQLMVFAALLVWLASRPVIRAWLALLVVAADALWVVGTVPVVLSDELTRTGDVTATAIALVVATFGVLQLMGVLRMRAAPVPA